MRLAPLKVLVFLTFCLAARAQGIRITSGLVDDQVLQRSSDDRAQVRLSGVVNVADGRTVEARVLRKFVPVAGLDWYAMAKVEHGTWSGEIRQVPTGGPYRVEVRIADTTDSFSVKDVLVGDVWVLAGQSNMRGLGALIDVEQANPLVHTFDMADHWRIAEEPLHGMGAGLGLPFAVEMVRRTGVPIGLIPCAIGATSMDLWAPNGKQMPLKFFTGAYHASSQDLLPRALREKGSNSLYEAMLRRFHSAGAKLKGMLWYQGESDSSAATVPLFQQKFERFVAAARHDFGRPDLPFYYVQVSRHVGDESDDGWNQLQEIQRELESRISHAAMAVAVDLTLDDSVHVGTEGHKRLGGRLAKLACRDLFPTLNDCRELKKGPRPVSAIREKGVVRGAFSDVNGSLHAPGRISGFSIHSSGGQVLPLIYKARIDPADGSTVLLYIQGNLPADATLHYGYGSDPYCNLTDQQDMAVPAFGPMPIR